MTSLDPGILVTIVIIIISCLSITVGTIASTVTQGRAVLKTLEGMTRQPEMAGDLRTTLLIGLAMLETGSIYVLLIVLIFIFANPLLDRFLGG